MMRTPGTKPDPRSTPDLPGIVLLEEGRGHLRASDADREQAIDLLKAAFVQGRLARDDFEARVGQAFGARTHAELAAVTAGLPARMTTDQPPRAPAQVREQRTRREMSQGELAAVLGVSRQTVISIESGRYVPSLPLAFAIARLFGLTVDNMFGPGAGHYPGSDRSCPASLTRQESA